MENVNKSCRFSRTELMLGEKAMSRLAASCVAIFGVGGVGGYALEALVRSGVGSIYIIDPDTVSESNINRQIIATRDTVGRPKSELWEERIKAINPDCNVIPLNLFIFAPEHHS